MHQMVSDDDEVPLAVPIENELRAAASPNLYPSTSINPAGTEGEAEEGSGEGRVAPVPVLLVTGFLGAGKTT